MGLLRHLLLWGSQSDWLKEQLADRRFTRRAVARFMPGEDLESALDAAGSLAEASIASVLTSLGENVTKRAEAERVTRHYLDAVDRIAEHGLDAELSVKLTQLGLDLDGSHARGGLERIVTKAEARGLFVWIDMESSAYTDRTLALYRRTSPGHPGLGICLQAYLRRTASDLERLLPLDPAIRLVKGAYREPRALAFPRKRDVDANYLALAERILDALAAGRSLRLGVATHDLELIRRVHRAAERRGLAARTIEVQMLYGIRREAQRRLAARGRPVRVLISYGGSWFPWFMRRLAERPANLLFLLRQLARR